MPYAPYYPSGWENEPDQSTPIVAAALDAMDSGIATAQTAAEGAQSTADAAVSDAASAQTTADNAQATADTAVSDAATAVSDAAAAQTTADAAIPAPAVAAEAWQILQPNDELELTWQNFNAYSVGLGWLLYEATNIPYAEAVNLTERPADVPITFPVRIYGGTTADPSPFTSWMLAGDYWDAEDA